MCTNLSKKGGSCFSTSLSKKGGFAVCINFSNQNGSCRLHKSSRNGKGGPLVVDSAVDCILHSKARFSECKISLCMSWCVRKLSADSLFLQPVSRGLKKLYCRV